MVLQLGIGDFHHFWFVDGDLLLTDGQLVENLAAHHLLHLSRLRLVRSLFPPVSGVVERTPSIRRFLGLHEATNVYLKPVYLVEKLLEVKPVRQSLHVLLDCLSFLPLLAELYPADIAKHERYGVLIEDEQLHLLAESHLLLLLLLCPLWRAFVILREA